MAVDSISCFVYEMSDNVGENVTMCFLSNHQSKALNIQSTVMNDDEEHQILTVEKL